MVLIKRGNEFVGYKIIASDLDGTLLNSEAGISEENLSAISELSKRGAFLVPSTGRSFLEIPVELKNNPDIRYYIYSNGATVLDKVTGKRISNCLSDSQRQFIIDTLMPFDVHLTIRQNGQCFVDKDFQTKAMWDYYNVCEAHRVVVRDYAVHLSDFKEFSQTVENAEVFSLFFHSYGEKTECKKIIEENEGLSAVGADEYNLEIISSLAGKGKALCSLANMLGVEIKDTIALGDSDNDTSIIKASGLGLAVSNATPSLKAIADKTVCSNDEHAILYVLTNFF